MATDKQDLTIEIICTKPPGKKVGERQSVHLAIQKDTDLLDAKPADQDPIVFKPVLRVEEHADGSPNFLGPFAQGPRSQRFIYLVWADMPRGQAAQRFSRIKLQLNHLKWADVQKALTRKKPIKVTLSLTDAKGQPVVATIRPNGAKWDL
jgi:hypothetical protein